MSTALLLIHPQTHNVSARYTEKSVAVLDSWLLHGLSYNGIAVPGGFDPGGKHYIYPTDEPKLFARAFKEEFFCHGLMQAGYYWIKEEDYIGPKEEVEKALKHVLEALSINRT